MLARLLLAALLTAVLAAGCSDDGGPRAQTDAIDDGDPGITDVTEGPVEVLGAAIHVETLVVGGDAPTVVLLHGAAFTSADWFDLGIAQDLAHAGVTVVALDLPGRGESDDIDLDDEAAFLPAFFEAWAIDPAAAVIVSPSMSGIFSLPALRDPAFADLGGYVPVAPSGGRSFAEDGPVLDIPALVIRGDGDGEDPAAIAENLASAFAEAEVWIVPDAGHSAYVDAPDDFVARVAAFAHEVGG